jgi:hypothetical protein
MERWDELEPPWHESLRLAWEAFAAGSIVCVLLAEADAPPFERAALRWLERFIAKRLR